MERATDLNDAARKCTNPTQIPNQTIASGSPIFADNNALAATNVVINGSGAVTFAAGTCIDLGPGFHATAGTAPITFHAMIGTVTQIITASPPGLALTIDGAACAAPCSVQWTAGTNHTIAAATQSGGAGMQYLFTNWSDSGAASHSVTAPATQTTYTATFATQFFLTTSPGAGGSIVRASGWYNGGTGVSVRAVPDASHQFAGFSGAPSAAPPPRRLSL
jgi:hypothetical protein